MNNKAENTYVLEFYKDITGLNEIDTSIFSSTFAAIEHRNMGMCDFIYKNASRPQSYVCKSYFGVLVVVIKPDYTSWIFMREQITVVI